MHPSTREKQVHGMAAGSLNAIAAQIAVPELQNSHGSEGLFDLDVSSGHDDFLDEILSGLATSGDASASDRQWIVGIGEIPEEGLQYAPFDESTLLTNRLWQYQIGGGSSSAEKTMMLPLGHDCQQKLLVAGSGNSGLRPLPMTLGRAASIDSPNSTVRRPNFLLLSSSYLKQRKPTFLLTILFRNGRWSTRFTMVSEERFYTLIRRINKACPILRFCKTPKFGTLKT